MFSSFGQDLVKQDMVGAGDYNSGTAPVQSRKTRVIWYLHDTSCHGGARGVIVIIVGNEHGDTSSNPARNSLHFT